MVADIVPLEATCNLHLQGDVPKIGDHVCGDVPTADVPLEATFHLPMGADVVPACGHGNFQVQGWHTMP